MSDYFEKFPVINTSWLQGKNLVYHCREEDTRMYVDGVRVFLYVDEVDRWETRTSCGLLLDYWTRDFDSGSRFTHLSAEFADMIARPCRKCWDVTDA